MGFFVVPVAFTRSVFRPSDAARLPIPQLRGYSALTASTPPCFAHPGAAFPRSDNSARSRNPDSSRNPDRTLNLRCTQPLPAPTTRPPVLPPPPSSAAPAHSNHPPARNLLPDYRPESCRLAHSHSPDPSRAEPEPRPNAGLEPDLRCTQPLPVPTTRPPVLPPPSRSRTIL